MTIDVYLWLQRKKAMSPSVRTYDKNPEKISQANKAGIWVTPKKCHFQADFFFGFAKIKTFFPLTFFDLRSLQCDKPYYLVKFRFLAHCL